MLAGLLTASGGKSHQSTKFLRLQTWLGSSNEVLSMALAGSWQLVPATSSLATSPPEPWQYLHPPMEVHLKQQDYLPQSFSLIDERPWRAQPCQLCTWTKELRSQPGIGALPHCFSCSPKRDGALPKLGTASLPAHRAKGEMKAIFATAQCLSWNVVSCKLVKPPSALNMSSPHPFDAPLPPWDGAASGKDMTLGSTAFQDQFNRIKDSFFFYLQASPLQMKKKCWRCLTLLMK